jgi:hypothetical protein
MKTSAKPRSCNNRAAWALAPVTTHNDRLLGVQLVRPLGDFSKRELKLSPQL